MTYRTPPPLLAGLILACVCLLAKPSAAQDDVATSREIAEALKSPNSQIRHDTWKRMSAEDGSHFKRLVWVLKSKPWFDREGAVTALAKAFSEDVLDRMVKYLEKDKDAAVRQGMALALAKMNDEKYYAKLYEALDDKDPTVRRTVAHALRVHKKPEAVDALIARFGKEDDPVVRNFIEDALNELTQAFRGPRAVDWLSWWEVAKRDPDYELGKTDEEAKKEAEELGRKLKKSRTVSISGGVTVEAAERGIGTGVPILVLPFYGYSKETMLPFLSDLETRHKLIYIDLPPVESFKGLSKVGATNMPYYPIDNLVEAFEDMRKERDQEHFAIMACGLNSWIAMRYAQTYPDSLAATILISPFSGNKAFGSAVDRFVSVGKRDRDRELEYLGYSMRTDIRTGKSVLEQKHEESAEQYPVLQNEQACIERRSWSTYFADDRDAVLSMLFPIRQHRLGGVLIPDFECFREPKLSKRVPMLVICGKESLWTTPEDGKAIAKHYGGLALVYSKTSNMPFAEESERFNKDVAGFLKRYTRAKSSSSDEDDEDDSKSRRRR